MAGMIINVKISHNGEEIKLNLKNEATVQDIKNALEEKYGGGGANYWNISLDEKKLENENRIKEGVIYNAKYSGRIGKCDVNYKKKYLKYKIKYLQAIKLININK